MVYFRIFSTGLILLTIIACSDTKQGRKDQNVETKMESDRTAETSSDVPALWDFHEVIYQIWHEAWPEKNTTMLKELIPEIEAGFAKLKEADLPGILRDKKEDWNQGIQEMSEIIQRYKDAADAGQREALLKAAEDLHTQFERLVRLIRPVMEEIDQFHQELYMIYHYYMPENNIEKIKSSTQELLKQMDPIDQAKLPDRLKDKQQTYEQAKTQLREALEQLSQTVANRSPEDQVKLAIETVHDKYQSLVAVFE
jgi:hypothetical protein